MSYQREYVDLDRAAVAILCRRDADKDSCNNKVIIVCPISRKAVGWASCADVLP
jgi:hypothetical protein